MTHSIFCNAKRHYAEYHCAECRYAECHNAEFRGVIHVLSSTSVSLSVAARIHKCHEAFLCISWHFIAFHCLLHCIALHGMAFHGISRHFTAFHGIS